MVNKQALVDYTTKLIYYVIVNHRSEVIELLRAKGLIVDENTSTKLLHFIVLKAMAENPSFKKEFTSLISRVAGEYENQKNGSYHNVTGDITDTAPQSVDELLKQGVTIVVTLMQQGGNATISGEVSAADKATTDNVNTKAKIPATIAKKGFPYKTVIIVLAVGIAGYYAYKHFNK